MATLVVDSQAVDLKDVFMARLVAGDDARAAWDRYQRMVIGDAQMRQLIRMLHDRRDPMLDESRRVWRSRGFNQAPFDFLFDEDARR